MSYLLDMLYLFTPLSLVLLLAQLGVGDRLGATALLLLALASLYPIYALVVGHLQPGNATAHRLERAGRARPSRA